MASDTGSSGGRLENREGRGDEWLTDDLLGEFSLFKQHIDASKLSNHPGAVVMRRYRKGEAICRQAESGNSAFFICTKTDIHGLRKIQGEATEAVIKMMPDLAGLDEPAWRKLTITMQARARAAEERLGLLKEWIKLAETDESKLKNDRIRERHETKLAETKAALEQKEPEFLAKPLEAQRLDVEQEAENVERTGRLATLLRRAVHPKRLSGIKAEAQDLENRIASVSEVRPAAHVYLQFQKGAGQSARLHEAMAANKGPSPVTKLVAKVKSAFGAKKKPQRRKYVTGFIPIDGPVDLRYDEPIAEMYEGEIFGEMSCMNRSPRSATVTATEDCYMLEFVRSILEVLQKSESFNQMMLEKYKDRVLELHLGEIELFRGLKPEALQRLKDGVSISYFDPGETIFEEGDTATCMYVVRVGHVKVFRVVDGVMTVLAYAGRGDLIGEMGLIEGKDRNATCQAYDHPEEAKGARPKVGRVELVMITKPLLEEVQQVDPNLERRIRKTIEERRLEEERLAESTVAITGPVDDLGLLQGRKLMLIDLERCTRCDDCVRACAETHDDGRSRLVREGPRFGNYLVPASCRQCRDPVCMIGCPVGSIRKGDFGEIVIEDWCIGCAICAEQCPYGSIHMHERAPEEIPEIGRDQVAEKPMAVVCDQCQSLKDGIPSCVYACPQDAAGRVDAWKFFSDADNRFRSLLRLTYDHLQTGGKDTKDRG